MIKIHILCGTPISYTPVNPGFPARCLKCDEDLYAFEIEEACP